MHERRLKVWRRIKIQENLKLITNLRGNCNSWWFSGNLWEPSLQTLGVVWVFTFSRPLRLTFSVFGARRSQQQPSGSVHPGRVRPVRPPQEPDSALQPAGRLPVRPGPRGRGGRDLQTGEAAKFTHSSTCSPVNAVSRLPPGCPGAAGETGQIALLAPSDPPAEQPDVPSVPGAGQSPAQPAPGLP